MPACCGARSGPSERRPRRKPFTRRCAQWCSESSWLRDSSRRPDASSSAPASSRRCTTSVAVAVRYALDTNVYFHALDDPRYLARDRPALLQVAPHTFFSSVVGLELAHGARGDVGRASDRESVVDRLHRASHRRDHRHRERGGFRYRSTDRGIRVRIRRKTHEERRVARRRRQRLTARAGY